MQLAVISDLHLGPSDASDVFGHEDGEFLRFLGFLERNFERIVLLGDVWETLTARWPGAPARALEESRRAHPELAARFRRSAYRYLFGNHDWIAASVDGAAEDLVLDADGTRILFTHGHQNDALIARARWLSEATVWLGGWALRLGLSSVHRTAQRIDDVRDGSSSKAEDCPVQSWALGAAARRSADVVVTGHTHRSARAEHGSRLYLNSGTCSWGRLSWLSLDTRAGRYAVEAGY